MTIAIRKLDSLPDFHRCVDLQREIWGESDLETEPYVTFVVAANTLIFPAANSRAIRSRSSAGSRP